MATSFKDLTIKDKEHITNTYETHKSGNTMSLIQEDLAMYFGVTKRTVRNWANRLDLNMMAKNYVDPFSVLVYDIETSRVPAMVFWTGKTYINHKQLKDEPKIISISWKWLGEDKVHHVTWDKIQFGTAEIQKEALKGMVEYNVGDILSTEEIYIEMRKYFGHKTHLGVILGENRASCPNCGGTNVEEYNGDYSVTPAGTIQRHMICRDDRVQYKISNTNFLKFIDSQ